MLAASVLPATTKPLPCGSRLGKQTDRLPFPTAQTRSQDGKKTSPQQVTAQQRTPGCLGKHTLVPPRPAPANKPSIHKAAHTQWHTRQSEAMQSKTFWGHK